jgi:hypothetical protein
MNALTEVMEQAQKLLFLMGLRGIVGGPILGVGGLFDGIGDRDRVGECGTL